MDSIGTTGTIVALAIYGLMLLALIAGGWKMFEKAGLPGWGVIVPIYNIFLVLKMAGKPGWWLLLLIIPIVNCVVGIMLSVAIAQKFGKGAGFILGMIFLPFIFVPILGFGSAQYIKK